VKYKISTPQAIYELGKRDNQEDAIYPRLGEASSESRLFLVCDGMGGHEHGEVASNAVADAMSKYIREHFSADEVVTDTMLHSALEIAYQELDMHDSDEARKMGTTLTLLCLHRGGVTVAHMGDSRIYHLRPATGEILYISRDHSLVMDLYQAGEISREEMRTSPQKNVITRAMIPGADNRSKVDIAHITDVKPDDYFFLCSDGMLEQMSDSELLNIIADNTTDEEKREVLVNATQNNKDNHSAYLIHVLEVVSESLDASQPNDEMTSKFNAVNIFKQNENQEENEDDDVKVIPTPPPFKPRAQQAEGNDVTVIPDSSHKQKRMFSLKSILKWMSAAVLLIIFGLVFFLTKGNSNDKNTTKDSVESKQDTTNMHIKQDSNTIVSAGVTTLPSVSSLPKTTEIENKAKVDAEKDESKPATEATRDSTSNKRGWLGTSDSTKHT
jgi:protein phosphatase